MEKKDDTSQVTSLAERREAKKAQDAKIWKIEGEDAKIVMKRLLEIEESRDKAEKMIRELNDMVWADIYKLVGLPESFTDSNNFVIDASYKDEDLLILKLANMGDAGIGISGLIATLESIFNNKEDK